jgi:hypothetical protein
MSISLYTLRKRMTHSQLKRYDALLNEYLALRSEVLDLPAALTDGRVSLRRQDILTRAFDE